MVPKAAAPVQDIGRDRNHRAGGNMNACELVVGDRLTGSIAAGG